MGAVSVETAPIVVARPKSGGEELTATPRDRADHTEAGDHHCPACRFGDGAGKLVTIPDDLVENRRRLARARHAEVEQRAVFGEIGEAVPAACLLIRLAQYVSVGKSDEDTCAIEGTVEAERGDVGIRLLEIEQAGPPLGDELPRRRYAVRADDKVGKRLGRIPDVDLTCRRATTRIEGEGFGECVRRNGARCSANEQRNCIFDHSKFPVFVFR